MSAVNVRSNSGHSLGRLWICARLCSSERSTFPERPFAPQCFLSSDAVPTLSTEAEGFVTVRLAIWTATKQKGGGVLPGKVADKPALRWLTSRLTSSENTSYFRSRLRAVRFPVTHRQPRASYGACQLPELPPPSPLFSKEGHLPHLHQPFSLSRRNVSRERRIGTYRPTVRIWWKAGFCCLCSASPSK